MARKSQRFRRQRRVDLLKAKEQEAKLTKSIEDNSAILERMKSMSSIIDQVCETIEPTPESEVAHTIEMKAEPIVEMKEEPSVEMKIQPFIDAREEESSKEIPNYKRMTKRQLVGLAKESGITIKPTMTKAQIIKAIKRS